MSCQLRSQLGIFIYSFYECLNTKIIGLQKGLSGKGSLEVFDLIPAQNRANLKVITGHPGPWPD